MTQGYSSKETKLYYDSDGNGTWVAIAEVKRIAGPNPSKEQIDMTHLDSPGDYREFLASFKDGGQINLDCNFVPASHTDQFDDFNNDEVLDFKIVWATSNYQSTFSGYYQGYSNNAGVGEGLGFSLTIKITGEITLAAVS